MEERICAECGAQLTRQTQKKFCSIRCAARHNRVGPEVDIPPAQRSTRRAWMEAHREEIAAYQKVYRRENRHVLNVKKLIALKRTKQEGLVEYGGKCACCGETTAEFLTIDHINGVQSHDPVHGGERVTGLKLWPWLKKQGWPKDNYQLLCYNCNCAKGVYGSCPHTWSKEVMPNE